MSGLVHSQGIDLEHDGRAVSLPHFHGGLNVRRKMHVMAGHLSQAFLLDHLDQLPGSAMVQHVRQYKRLKLQIDLDTVALIRTDTGPRFVKGETLFVVARDNLLEFFARDRKMMGAARGEELVDL